MYVDAARHTANSATPIPGRGMRDSLQSDGWPPRNRATGAHESERPPADRFEALAAWSQRAEADSADIAAALLASSATAFDTVCDVLRPLWAEEAVHRAYSLLRLNAARLRPCRDMPAMQQDIALARRLAAGFRALAADRDAAMVSCLPILHEVVQTLGLLFGSATGRVQVTINIARMMLPAYKRRALVLAASELVVNALTHAFGPGDRGRIHVSLLRRSADNACLLVADDGRGLGRECLIRRRVLPLRWRICSSRTLSTTAPPSGRRLPGLPFRCRRLRVASVPGFATRQGSIQYGRLNSLER